MTLLDRLDAAIDGLCPCGAPPAPGSAYCGDDCRPTHIAADTDTRTRGHFATPMRWRPDLVTETDDTNLTPIFNQPGDRNGYRGPHNATVFERTDQPNTWHLRLDDGHRYVGADVDRIDIRDGIISTDTAARLSETWRRLEREFGNTRHLVADNDPWADVMPYQVEFYPTAYRPIPWRWLRRCPTCGQRGEPREGRRAVFDRYPSALLASSAYDYASEVERCHLCRHCRTPFPGPPLRLTVYGHTGRRQLRLRLTADGGSDLVHDVDLTDAGPGDGLLRLVEGEVDLLEQQLLQPAVAVNPEPNWPRLYQIRADWMRSQQFSASIIDARSMRRITGT